MAWRVQKSHIFVSLSVVLGIATLFFSYYGAVLVYTALTYEGEGSLGHVGMYIAAGLFPLLAFFFGALTYLAWRTAKRDASR